MYYTGVLSHLVRSAFPGAAFTPSSMTTLVHSELRRRDALISSIGIADIAGAIRALSEHLGRPAREHLLQRPPRQHLMVAFMYLRQLRGQWTEEDAHYESHEAHGEDEHGPHR